MAQGLRGGGKLGTPIRLLQAGAYGVATLARGVADAGAIGMAGAVSE